MARLTNHAYLQNHEQLRTARASDNTAFILLSPGEQWDLFRYYLPHKHLSAADLRAHRTEMSTLDPSLPQRAGRALHHLRRLQARLPDYQAMVMARPLPKKNSEKCPVVFSEVRPTVSPSDIAKIIWQDYLDEQSGRR